MFLGHSSRPRPTGGSRPSIVPMRPPRARRSSRLLDDRRPLGAGVPQQVDVVRAGGNIASRAVHLGQPHT